MFIENYLMIVNCAVFSGLSRSGTIRFFNGTNPITGTLVKLMWTLTGCGSQTYSFTQSKRGFYSFRLSVPPIHPSICPSIHPHPSIMKPQMLHHITLSITSLTYHLYHLQDNLHIFKHLSLHLYLCLLIQYLWCVSFVSSLPRSVGWLVSWWFGWLVGWLGVVWLVG